MLFQFDTNIIVVTLGPTDVWKSLEGFVEEMSFLETSPFK